MCDGARRAVMWTLIGLCAALSGCQAKRRDPGTAVFLIESSPNSLDPRVGTDAQSERIDPLLFDGLVARDEHYQFQPALAASWETPDALTLLFHLRHDVRFSDGRRLTAADVLWTLESMRDGTILTPKGASYDSVASVEAVDAWTVRIRLKEPDNFLLGNLSSSAMGIVPAGSRADFWRHPVGTGAFRLVSQETDKEVVVERNPFAWERATVPGALQRVRFEVVPDATTRALELRKGAADITSNSLPSDMLPVLKRDPKLVVEETGGTPVQYLAFNLRDPVLGRRVVRAAIAHAVDRRLLVRTLLGGEAQLAESLLPPTHWAYTDDVKRYDYDPAKARAMLNAAGFPPGRDGVRLRLTMKTSTDEGTRMLAVALQQQLAQIGIALEIRSMETATFFSDITRGAFQIYSLRWIGGNEQPDIFSYAFSTVRMPPHGANREHYANAEVDRLLDAASRVTEQQQRRADYVRVQQILAEDLPMENLWYLNSILVHDRRVTGVKPSASGDYLFLLNAKISSLQ
jgi:peptide/nickel transport system substrate-binding protein